MRKLIINLFVLLMIFAAISCTAESYIFTYQTTDGATLYNADGDVVSSVVSIQDGKTATEVKAVHKNGKVYDVVWYADSKCSELYDFDTPIHDVTTIYGKLYDDFVTITASDKFYFKADVASGTTLQYSVNCGCSWKSYTSTTTEPIHVEESWFKDGSGQPLYKLLLRGVGNTVIVGEAVYNNEGQQVMKPVSSPEPELPQPSDHGGAWKITYDEAGTNPIKFSCEGDIRTLLDYTKVRARKGVTIGAYAFANMFAGTEVTFIPDLSKVSVFGEHAFENTFNKCKRIKISTEKPTSTDCPYVKFVCEGSPATTYCENMFVGCFFDKDDYSTPVKGKTYYIIGYDMD